MSHLNQERGFVAHIFSKVSEGNDPRCGLVMNTAGNEDGRKKPLTNVVSWATMFIGKTSFSVRQLFSFSH